MPDAPRPSEPLYEFGLSGAMFKVWPTYVEYVSGFGPFKKTTTLPMRTIATVEASSNPMNNKITITTNDGKKHSYSVREPEKARQAILQNMG